MKKQEILDILSDELTYIEDQAGNKRPCVEIDDFNDIADAILRLRIVSREFKEKHTPTFEEFMINFCKHGITLTNNYTRETIGLKELIHKWKLTNDIKP